MTNLELCIYHNSPTFGTLIRRATCYTRIICYHIKGVCKKSTPRPPRESFYPRHTELKCLNGKNVTKQKISLDGF